MMQKNVEMQVYKNGYGVRASCSTNQENVYMHLLLIGRANLFVG